MRKKTKKINLLINTFFALGLFVSINIISNNVLVGLRLDMTAEGIYTLSDATKKFLKNLDDPIQIKLYYSKRNFSGYPDLTNYGNLIKDTLTEYVNNSDGKLDLTIIDPNRFSEAEEEAELNGLVRIGLTEEKSGFLGAVATNMTNKKIILELFQLENESMLEHDITKMLLSLTSAKKQEIGIITQLPLLGASNPPSSEWAIYKELKNNYEVTPLRFDTETIPNNIDTLLLIHPKNLNKSTLQAIEQFSLSGGNIIVFVDPLAESDPTTPDPTTPGIMPNLSSNPDILLKSWGINFDPNYVIGNPDEAVYLNITGDSGPEKQLYLPWLQLKKANFSASDFSTSSLSVLNIGTAGSLSRNNATKLETIPLIFSSGSSGLLRSESIIKAGNPKKLRNLFEKDNNKHIIAMRVSGLAKAIFNEANEPNLVNEGKINAVIVADTDILTDRFWARPQQSNNRNNYTPFSDNGDFVTNLIDLFAGSGELISLRSRGNYSKPFELVESLRREAEIKYRGQEKALQEKLAETERDVQLLENASRDGSILSAEDNIEIKQIKETKRETLKKLRSVRYQLIEDITTMGNYVKFINIGLMPLVILLLSTLITLRKSYF